MSIRTRGTSPFQKGDKVVYPHHGAAVIEDLVEREILGERRTYFKLRLAHGDLTLMVPIDNTREVGLREVVSKREVRKVFDLLREEEEGVSTNWSRRYKINLAKLSSGDIYQVAEVVRNLSQREKDKGLSAGEKHMLAKARQILISELTFAFDSTEERAEAMLDKVLQEAAGEI
jgi:CarD family transcriptional regulator, regulator of rRNA transcription